MSDFRIQVDTVVNTEGNGGPRLPFGLQTGNLAVNSPTNVTITGIVTTHHLNAQSIQATNVTGVLYGDGSDLTSLPSITMSKAYALKCIISDPPLRS